MFNASGTSGANILFLTKADGGTLAERMRITSGGNVGIGTDTTIGLLTGLITILYSIQRVI